MVPGRQNVELVFLFHFSTHHWEKEYRFSMLAHLRGLEKCLLAEVNG